MRTVSGTKHNFTHKILAIDKWGVVITLGGTEKVSKTDNREGAGLLGTREYFSETFVT